VARASSVGVRWLKINYVFRALGRNHFKQIINRITMRVHETNPTSRPDILHNQIFQKFRFSSACFSNNIHVSHSVSF